MAGPPNLRFRGTLKTVQLGSVEYCEFSDALCVGCDDQEDKSMSSINLPVKFNQAPSGATVIGRMMKLVQKIDPETGKLTSKAKAAQIAASELRVFWVFAMTAPPIAIQNAATKITKVYDEFKSLDKYPKDKRGPSWLAKVEAFNNRMLTGLNIVTKDKKVIKKLKEEFEIQIKEEDVKLVEDNCREKTCQCPVNSVSKCKQCPRQMFITMEVDSEWSKWRTRKRNTEESNQLANEKSTQESQI